LMVSGVLVVVGVSVLLWGWAFLWVRPRILRAAGVPRRLHDRVAVGLMIAGLLVWLAGAVMYDWG